MWGAFGSVGALVAKGGEGGDKEMEKLFIGGEGFDGGVKIIVQLVLEDAGGFAKSLATFSEEGDFGNGAYGFGGVVEGLVWVLGWVEEMIEVGVSEGGKVDSGILLEILDEEIEKGDGTVERAGGSFDGPFRDGLGSFCGWSF